MPDIDGMVFEDRWMHGEVEEFDYVHETAGSLSRKWDLGVLRPHSTFTRGEGSSALGMSYSSRPFLVISRALSTTGHKIRELTAPLVMGMYGGLHLHVFDLSDIDLQHALSFSQHLRKLALTISTSEGEALNEPYFLAENVTRILSTVKALDMNSGWPLVPLILMFGNSTTWPYLRSVVLANLHADPEELLDLFRRHRATLKHVSLSFVSNEGNQWHEFYQSMRQYMNLQSFVTDGPAYSIQLDAGGAKLGNFPGDSANSVRIAAARVDRVAMETDGWFEFPDGFDSDAVLDRLVD